MIEQAIGTWSKGDGLVMKDADMWQRRANLRGAPVRMTSIKYPVFSQEFTMDSYGRPIGGKGYLLDMLRMMTRDLNFTAPLSLSVDGKFGGKNKDGSWNGMVGMLTIVLLVSQM